MGLLKHFITVWSSKFGQETTNLSRMSPPYCTTLIEISQIDYNAIMLDQVCPWQPLDAHKEWKSDPPTGISLLFQIIAGKFSWRMDEK